MNVTIPFSDNYVLECTADGGFYAYFSGYEQGFVFGETVVFALANI